MNKIKEIYYRTLIGRSGLILEMLFMESINGSEPTFPLKTTSEPKSSNVNTIFKHGEKYYVRITNEPGSYTGRVSCIPPEYGVFVCIQVDTFNNELVYSLLEL